MSFGSRPFGSSEFGGRGGASFPFVQRTSERAREHDKRNRAWVWAQVSQLLEKPFRPGIYTLERLKDRPSVSRAWEWGQQEAEELTPPFVGSTMFRLRDGPSYIYGRFDWHIPLPTVTSTNFVQLPINCVMIGNQIYKRSDKTFEIHLAGVKTTVRGEISETSRLQGDAPSFTVKTGTKGYD